MYNIGDKVSWRYGRNTIVKGRLRWVRVRGRKTLRWIPRHVVYGHCMSQGTVVAIGENRHEVLRDEDTYEVVEEMDVQMYVCRDEATNDLVHIPEWQIDEYQEKESK